MPQAAAYRAAACLIVCLIKKIILIVRSCEVILSPGFASEGLAVTDFLQIVQTAGDALIAVAVESVEVLPYTKTFEKSSEKIGKSPGLIPRPSESQVRLYYSVERGGSLEGQ